MPQRPSLASVQALRGIAAVLVVLFHLRIVEERYGGGATLLPDAMRFADGGVDLFFVISGFIMATITAGTFDGTGAARRFLARRAWRILPLYWFYTTIVVALMVIAPGLANSSYQDQSIVLSYLLWPQPVLPVLTVGWTLIHEMYFYLVIAALLALGRPRLLMPALLVWTLLVVVAHLVPSPGTAWYALISSPMTLEFVGGAVLGLHWRRIPRSMGALLLCSGATVFAMALPVLHMAGAEQGPVLRTMVFGTSSVLVLAGAVLLEDAGRFTVPASLKAIGDSSYSLYLSHVFVVSAVGRLWHMSGLTTAWWHHATFLACAVGLSILVGLASFHLLERPLLRAGQHLLPGRKRTQATAQPV